jgi:hypothetical protein
MNQTVKFHAQKIVDIAISGDGYSLYGGQASSMGSVPQEHIFTVSNTDKTETSYTCLIQNVEMGIDIIEVAHDLLISKFERDTFNDVFSKLDLDLNQPLYLLYTKYIG